MRLREYIACYHPSVSVRLEQGIKIQACKVVYLDYQSKVDWRNARDILRCNPKFHNAPRFDSVIYETDDDQLAMGQLQFVFRAHLPSHDPSIPQDFLAAKNPYRLPNSGETLSAVVHVHHAGTRCTRCATIPNFWCKTRYALCY
ncbi:hypothetical protein B0H13DRAFT_2206143 [Mycena leptocephala]|nr:hypothetical protein B0H13DRAFT_2206143 [Mycena leptocephala]